MLNAECCLKRVVWSIINRLFRIFPLQNKDRANNNKKIQEKGAINSEADAQSDSGSGDDGNTSPTPDNKLHVEFVEAEIIAADDTVVSKVPTLFDNVSFRFCVNRNCVACLSNWSQAPEDWHLPGSR